MEITNQTRVIVTFVTVVVYSGMLKSCLNLEIIVNSWGALDLKSRAFLVKRIGIAMFSWIWSLE